MSLLFFIEMNLEQYSQIADIITGIFSLLFAVFIFVHQIKKDTTTEIKNKNIDWLHKLIIEPKLTLIYGFYDDLIRSSVNLKTHGLTNAAKSRINFNNNDLFEDFENSFTILLLAIDRNLYDKIKDELYELQDYLTTTIFDSNIILSNEVVFNNSCKKPIIENRTKLLQILFNYRGG